MESILVSWILAFSHAHQLLDLIHFGEQLLILPIQEVNLTLLVLDLISVRSLVVIDHHILEGRRSDNMKSLDLLVPRHHLSIEHLDLRL
jgi:hypothetical protein